MLIAMGLLLIIAIIYAAFTSGGSIRSRREAGEKMWAYIDERYPDINIENHGREPEYTDAHSYSLVVSDADCSDIFFYVSYTNGNITDDYYYRVDKMTNTLIRLEGEMGDYLCDKLVVSGCDIISAEITFSPRVRNDIPDTIYPGVELDPKHPIFRGSTLTIVCRADRDMEKIGEIIKKTHYVAMENDLHCAEYCVYGLEGENARSLEITGITPEIAESESLIEILSEASKGTLTVSGTDIFVGIY